MKKWLEHIEENANPWTGPNGPGVREVIERAMVVFAYDSIERSCCIVFGQDLLERMLKEGKESDLIIASFVVDREAGQFTELVKTVNEIKGNP